MGCLIVCKICIMETLDIVVVLCIYQSKFISVEYVRSDDDCFLEPLGNCCDCSLASVFNVISGRTIKTGVNIIELL